MFYSIPDKMLLPALMLETARLEELHALIAALLDDEARRRGMADAMRRMARPEAAERLATLLRGVAS